MNDCGGWGLNQFNWNRTPPQHRQVFKTFGSLLSLHTGTRSVRFNAIVLNDSRSLMLRDKCLENNYKNRVLVFIAPAYSKVRYRGSTFRPFVRSSVRPSTIYVKVLTL